MTKNERELMVAALTRLLNERKDRLDDPSYTTDLARRIDLLIERKDLKLQDERFARLQLLDRHGWKGVIAGMLIIIGGAPGLMEENFGLWARPILGYLAVLAGALLLIGQRLYSNGRLEKVGLIALGTWDAIFGIALIHGIVTYGGPWVVNWPWELQSMERLQPRLYPPVIYFSLALMLWGPHLRALMRDHRDSREERKSPTGTT